MIKMVNYSQTTLPNLMNNDAFDALERAASFGAVFFSESGTYLRRSCVFGRSDLFI